jgi:hypothetical protein
VEKILSYSCLPEGHGALKMNQELNQVRIEILKNFPTQGDFAQAIPVHESFVSQVLRGRRQLNVDQAKRWSIVLKCDPAILRPVTRA